MGAKEVRTVYLTIGEQHDIVDDLFRGCFAYMARGTVAEKASLDITRVPLTVKCSACGAVHGLDLRDPSSRECPVCHAGDYRLNTGREFSIDGIEVS